MTFHIYPAFHILKKMTKIDQIHKILKQLQPRGRAFEVKKGTNIDRLFSVFATMIGGHANDVESILNEILPDNPYWTPEICAKWEKRLGMVVQSNAVPVADRIQSIFRKYNHPSTILARQSVDYMQNELQLAGFPVFVHENIPRSYPQNFVGSNVTGIAVTSATTEHSPDIVHGNVTFGSLWENVVANHIDESRDAWFDVGSNTSDIFYIGGQNIGDFQTIDINRKNEFRQLILKLKPVTNTAILFINYS